MQSPQLINKLCTIWNPKVHYRRYNSSPLSLSSAKSIQSRHSHSIYWRSILISSSHLSLGLSSWIGVSEKRHGGHQVNLWQVRDSSTWLPECEAVPYALRGDVWRSRSVVMRKFVSCMLRNLCWLISRLCKTPRPSAWLCCWSTVYSSDHAEEMCKLCSAG
jgi:hypothetical protein